MTIAAETDLQRAAKLFELWRLCRKSHCKRARMCRGDARACCEMLLDWSEALSLKDKRVGFEEAMQRLRDKEEQYKLVMPGLVPGIHGLRIDSE